MNDTRRGFFDRPEFRYSPMNRPYRTPERPEDVLRPDLEELDPDLVEFTEDTASAALLSLRNAMGILDDACGIIEDACGDLQEFQEMAAAGQAQDMTRLRELRDGVRGDINVSPGLEAYPILRRARAMCEYFAGVAVCYTDDDALFNPGDVYQGMHRWQADTPSDRGFTRRNWTSPGMIERYQEEEEECISDLLADFASDDGPKAGCNLFPPGAETNEARRSELCIRTVVLRVLRRLGDTIAQMSNRFIEVLHSVPSAANPVTPGAIVGEEAWDSVVDDAERRAQRKAAELQKTLIERFRKQDEEEEQTTHPPLDRTVMFDEDSDLFQKDDEDDDQDDPWHSFFLLPCYEETLQCLLDAPQVVMTSLRMLVALGFQRLRELQRKAEQWFDDLMPDVVLKFIAMLYAAPSVAISVLKEFAGASSRYDCLPCFSHILDWALKEAVWAMDERGELLVDLSRFNVSLESVIDNMLDNYRKRAQLRGINFLIDKLQHAQQRDLKRVREEESLDRPLVEVGA